MQELVELDSVEVLVIVDNELDPISPCPSTSVQQSGGGRDISARSPLATSDVRLGGSNGPGFEYRMDKICCGAHGLSLLITGIKDGQKHTLLFDAGPEGDIWERNVTRLRPDLSQVDLICLSHWHKDHSGGILKALDLIHEARTRSNQDSPQAVTVDLHPNRPAYRGIQVPGAPIVSLEEDPAFDEITKHNGLVEKHDEAHAVLDNTFLISGEIPRVTDYEKGFKFGVAFNTTTNRWEEDETIADERFVLCRLKDKGTILFTGCSHAGVVNASKHAVDLVGHGKTPLYAVVGGFHLADAAPAPIQNTVADLKALNVRVAVAGHCTGWRAKFELQRQMPGCFVPCFVGSRFVF